MRGDRGFFELDGLAGRGLVGRRANCRFAGRRLGCGRVAGERNAGERDLVALLGPVRGPFLGTRDCRALLDELLDDFDLPFLVAANLRKSSSRVASTGPSTSIIANWSPVSSVASAVLKMA